MSWIEKYQSGGAKKNPYAFELLPMPNGAASDNTRVVINTPQGPKTIVNNAILSKKSASTLKLPNKEQYIPRRATIREISKEEFDRKPSTWDILSHPATALKSKIENGSVPYGFEKGEINKLDYALDIINPATYLNAAGRTIKNIFSPINTLKTLGKGAINMATQLTGDGDAFDGATGEAIGIVGDAAMGAQGVKSMSKVVRLGMNAVDQEFSAVGQRLHKLKKQGLENGWNDLDIAQNQMSRVGITSNQRKAYTPVVSNFLEKYVTPYGYEGMGGKNKLMQTIDNIKNKGVKMASLDANLLDRTEVSPERADAWRLYLGKPQQNHTFRMANTSPVNHPSYANGSLQNMDAYAINTQYGKYDVKPYINHSLVSTSQRENAFKMLDDEVTIRYQNEIMGGYNTRLNKYGLEYNDIWDLEPSITPYSFLPSKLKRSAENIPIVKDMIFKNTQNGILPRSFKVPVKKAIGKPFMSHEVIPYTSTDLVNDFRQGMSKTMDGEAHAPIKLMLQESMKRLNEYPKFEYGGWVEKYKEGGLTQSQYLKQRCLIDANNKGDFDNISPNQAREILHDKKINGKILTPEQNRLFGFLSKGNTLKYLQGGNVSQMGYRDDSPYRNASQLNISTPSGLIDMSNTGIPLMAVDNTGMKKLLRPYSGQHQFKGTQVTETPWIEKYQSGGNVNLPYHPLTNTLGYKPNLSKEISSKLLRKLGDPLPEYKDAKNTKILKKILTSNSKMGYLQEGAAELDSAGYLAILPQLEKYGSPDIKDIKRSSRAWFNPITNTIRASNENTLISELSHAKQMSEQGKANFIKTLSSEWLNNPSFTKSQYEKNYLNENSFEHRAHSLYEPEIRREIEKDFMDRYKNYFVNKGAQFRNGGNIDLQKTKKQGGWINKYK